MKAVAACQRTMRACGLLQALCDILMASGVPADVLTETINTVAEVIRGNASNQEFLASVMAPSIPPRYILNILIFLRIIKRDFLYKKTNVLQAGYRCFTNVHGEREATIYFAMFSIILFPMFFIQKRSGTNTVNSNFIAARQ